MEWMIGKAWSLLTLKGLFRQTYMIGEVIQFVSSMPVQICWILCQANIFDTWSALNVISVFNMKLVLMILNTTYGNQVNRVVIESMNRIIIVLLIYK